MSSWVQIFRIVVLGWATLCSLILLGLGAHILSAVGGLGLPSFPFAGLAVATAVLALPSMVAMLVIDLLRTGAFTSMIVVEMSWLGFLGVLFLATGGAAAERAADFWVDCDAWSPASAQTVCSETSAAAAFGFLAWFPLWAYVITLLVFLIMHAMRGNYVWQKSVREANFEGGLPPPGPQATIYPENKAGQVPGTAHPYPPQPSVAVSPTPTGQFPQV